MKNNKPTNRLAAYLLPYARQYFQHHSLLLNFHCYDNRKLSAKWLSRNPFTLFVTLEKSTSE